MRTMYDQWRLHVTSWLLLQPVLGRDRKPRMQPCVPNSRLEGGTMKTGRASRSQTRSTTRGSEEGAIQREKHSQCTPFFLAPRLLIQTSQIIQNSDSPTS
ncbi:hypothetical protein FB45DRAFT_937910 [Roridomyces roridus]|uniref:Uncharacterized protein n=1 Tax=Roridomyces roridus TaxID=1738132 RepID=A0AAD7FEJ3_9AGAR|nr:hypothetical protein FB45DRAFT_937910 [Roridomyces roridus]